MESTKARTASWKRSKCFICLQKLSLTVTSHPWLLRNIARYVSVKGSTSRSLNSKGVCSECSILLSKFNELHGILEETRLRLNHSVQGVVDVMKEADDDLETSQMNSVSDQVGRERRNFLNQCLQKLKLDGPRLTLDHVNINTTTTIRKIKTETECKQDGFEHQQINEDIETNRLCTRSRVKSASMVPINTAIVKTESPRSPDLEEYRDLQEFEELDVGTVKHEVVPKARRPTEEKRLTTLPKFWSCPYCSKMFYRKYFVIHLAVIHPEHYLLKHKLPSVSPTQFKEIVQKFLLPDLLKPLKCTECGHTWNSQSTSQKKIALQRHWLRKHGDSDILSKKLLRLQMDPEVLGKCPKKDSENKSGRKKVKGKTFKYYLHRHKKTTTTITGVSKVRTQQCLKCLKWMRPSTLEMHKKVGLGRCKGMKQRYTSPRLTTVKCNGCQVKLPFVEWEEHKSHCRQMQGKESKFTVEPLPDSSGGPGHLVPVPCGECGKVLSTQGHLTYHQKYGCPKLPKVRISCTACGKEFHPTSLKKHLRERRCPAAKK